MQNLDLVARCTHYINVAHAIRQLALPHPLRVAVRHLCLDAGAYAGARRDLQQAIDAVRETGDPDLLMFVLDLDQSSAAGADLE